MKIIKKTILILVFGVLALVNVPAPAHAGVYGYILRVGATVGTTQVQNGSNVSLEEIKKGNFKYNLEVLNPTDSTSSVSVDKWDIALVDESGYKIDSFSLIGNPTNKAIYDAILSSVSSNLTLQQTVVLQAQAQIGGEQTNRVSFRITAVPEATPTATAVADLSVSQNSGFPIWPIVALAIGILGGIFYFLFWPRKLAHKIIDDKDNSGIPGVVVNIFDGRSKLISHQTTDGDGKFYFGFKSRDYVIEVVKDPMEIVEIKPTGKIFDKTHCLITITDSKETIEIHLGLKTQSTF
jgi:hypothetical protein